MKNRLKIYIAILLIFFFLGCSTPQIAERQIENSSDSASATLSVSEKPCDSGAVTLTTNFPTGRMDDCKRVGESHYLITLIPENSPINSSPWYAFKVQAKVETKITITMEVPGYKHRYPPKISHDGKTWQLQKYRIEGDRLIMQVLASPKTITIAAQEIINNQYYVDWAMDLSVKDSVSHSVLGESTQGRLIYKIESRNINVNEWIVILGRQHPPEVTGALALFSFVEALLSDSELGQSYRENYNILVIPNINPDGVYAGNWRHNANGLDLNRDWKDFSQVETRQINAYLEQLVRQGQKIKFAIDFHSTRHDVFYTIPVDYGVEDAYFVQHWLDDLDRKMPKFNVIMKPGNNPNLGVSKQYFSDKFGVHAITYEMGDNTDRNQIKNIAYNAANALMYNMMSDIEHDKE